MSEMAYRMILDVHKIFFIILFFINLIYLFAIFKSRTKLIINILPFFYTTITLVIFSGLLVWSILRFEFDALVLFEFFIFAFIVISQSIINKFIYTKKRKKVRKLFFKFKKEIFITALIYQILFLIIWIIR